MTGAVAQKTMFALTPSRWSVWLVCMLILSLAPQASAETTDATKSTASGNGLQYATAGVLAAFTVTAKVCRRCQYCAVILKPLLLASDSKERKCTAFSDIPWIRMRTLTIARLCRLTKPDDERRRHPRLSLGLPSSRMYTSGRVRSAENLGRR